MQPPLAWFIPSQSTTLVDPNDHTPCPGPCCSPAVSEAVSSSVVAALQRTDPPMLVSRNGSEGAGLYVAMDPRHAKASTCGCMLCVSLPTSPLACRGAVCGRLCRNAPQVEGHHAAAAARAAHAARPAVHHHAHPFACLALPSRLQGPWVHQLMQMVPVLGSGGSTSGMTPDHSHVRSSFAQFVACG